MKRGKVIVDVAEEGEDDAYCGEPTDHRAERLHTLSVVLVLTCFTMMSASDLSNCRCSRQRPPDDDME